MPADTFLSEMYLPLYPAIVPIHSYVFRICTTGTDEARTDKRNDIGSVANTEM